MLLTLVSYCQLAMAQEFKLAFGSCGHEKKPLETLQLAAERRPDVFVFVGDNIYGDTRDSTVLKAKYEMLAEKPTFRLLQARARLLATWDDHDYGENDAGRHYPMKETSKRIFLDFWKEPAHSQRRKHAGIYHAEYIPTAMGVVQILLLDTRTFRDDLLLNKANTKNSDARYFYPLDYLPFSTPDSTLLGKAQWQWLENELRTPAILRLVVSSTQFGVEYNGYEAWANFPHEQQRMFDLIKHTKAEGVLFLSGDVHYGELSRQQPPGLYPIYDFTSSGLSQTWMFATPNRYRIEGPIMENHIGIVSLQQEEKDLRIKLQIVDATGNERTEYSLLRSELTWK
jgi:alkaline phosphatase D